MAHDDGAQAGSAAWRRRKAITRIGLALFLFGLVAGCGGGREGPREVVNESAVGGLRLDQTLHEAQSERLVGVARKGCDIFGPVDSVAPLRGGVSGEATFAGPVGEKRLVSVYVTGGAETSEGVVVGMSVAEARRRHGDATAVVSAPGDPLEFSALVVRRDGRDVLWMDIDPGSARVRALIMPAPRFCE